MRTVTVDVTQEPVRLVRSRKRGSRLVSPNGLECVSVVRPGKWGNPFRAEVFGLDTVLALYREMVLGGWNPTIVAHLSDALVSEAYRLQQEWRKNFRRVWGGSSFDALREIRGANLVCWCPLNSRCHADVLLELANTDDAGRAVRPIAFPLRVPVTTEAK